VLEVVDTSLPEILLRKVANEEGTWKLTFDPLEEGGAGRGNIFEKGREVIIENVSGMLRTRPRNMMVGPAIEEP
jgi:hypothetical protein